MQRIALRTSACVAAVIVVCASLRPELFAARQAAALTAQQILDRSLAAHGGARLSSWRTMAITGTIEMEDRITYRAAYRVLAKMPDKLKVEQDMTADRGGRYVYEYFMNGDQAWSRRNLIAGKADPARLARWMNQCLGVAYYAKHATAAVLKPDATSDWLTKSAAGYQVSEKRAAYVVAVTADAGAVDLYFDKTTFQLLQETGADWRRLSSSFREFGGAVHPTRILEITRGRNNAEVITPITYDAIVYDQPIEDWVFEEDMPKRSGGK